MTSSIARRASLALASAAVAVPALLVTGGPASAATAAPGDSATAVSHTDRPGHTDRTPGPEHWAEICKQVNRLGGVKVVPRTDQQGHTGDAARIRWISDQIRWLCTHT
ncbi:hypothetical protein [Streptomyces sp. NPDC102462]|uniref:hypothetical protein n=1 Tax=Streptomyces sp. NPDC102462 TaxID=3366178 RepID=UPI003823D7D3